MSDISSNAGKAAGKAVRGARTLARSAARTTKRLGRMAKLNMDIAAERDAAKRLYTEIGRLYYEAHRDEPEGFFVQLFQKLDASMETIARKEAELSVLRADRKTAPPPAAEADPDITVEIEEEPDDPAEDDSEPVDEPDDPATVEIEALENEPAEEEQP